MSAGQKLTEVKDMEINAINKRKSGEAFEVILKLPGQSGEASCSPLKSPPPKKEISIDEIQSKLEAAEIRRKAQHDAVVKQSKAEEQKVMKAQQKKAEVHDTFALWAKENLKGKMLQYEENYGTLLQAKICKFKEQNLKPEELKEKVRREIDKMCLQREEQLHLKLSKSEGLRKQQLQNFKEKQQVKENHAQQVRQKKLQEIENNKASDCA